MVFFPQILCNTDVPIKSKPIFNFFSKYGTFAKQGSIVVTVAIGCRNDTILLLFTLSILAVVGRVLHLILKHMLILNPGDN